jgi:signal transduction histidine kinase
VPVFEQLRHHLDEVLRARARPFVLLLDDDLRVLAYEGDGSRYGFANLTAGQQLDAEVPFLQGLVGEVAEEQLIEFWGTPDGGAANVHLRRLPSAWGLIYLDVTAERDRRLRHQQAAHELALLEHQRARLVRELEASRAALAEADRLKGLFIARMSHEFRTPLSSVLGYADLLADELTDNPAALRDLGAIRRGGSYLLNLVENLLDQARLAHEELPLHPQEMQWQGLVAELDDLFRPLAEQRRLALHWQTAPRVPARLWLDGLRLRQVLVNLLGNALKFTREGGVTVTADWESGTLRVAIGDTGPGIAPDLLPRLFEPFRQGDRSKGAGLGLSISRALARRMGGSLSVAATSAAGTTLSLELPAAALETAARNAEASPPGPAGA